MAGTRRVIIRLCAAPVDSRSSPSRSRYPARSSLARAAASGVNSSRTRPIASSWSPPGAVMPSVRRRGAGTDAARLPGVTGQLREPLDVTLALDPRRVVRRQTVDQATDPVADLEREVRGGGPRERADVLHGDPMVGSHAIGSLIVARRSWRSWFLRRGRLRRPWRADGFRADAGTYLRHLREVVHLGLEPRRDRILISDQPDVVVDGPGGIVEIAGLDVEQIPSQRGGDVVRGVGEEQGSP